MAYPEAETIHLVMDNLNIHPRKALVDVFGTEMATEVWDRFTVHYTPTHGSWLNQAEIESGSSHGSVWAVAASRHSNSCATRPRPGTPV